MRKVLTVLAVLVFAGLCLEAGGQSSQPVPNQNHAVENQSIAQPGAHHYRPKLTMQDGLKIAEEYIADQHIDIAPYYLFQVRYILVGDEHTPDSKKIPGWYFWWCSDTQELGNYVEIFVDMDGHASRSPSM